MTTGEDADLLQSYADDAEAMKEERTDMEFKLGTVHYDAFTGDAWVYSGYRTTTIGRRENVWVRMIDCRWAKALQVYRATSPEAIRRKFNLGE